MDLPLYEKIADQIELQVRDGIFAPGTKIPSVRKSSKQLHVSVATILQAYSLLEDRGIIKARPQKGYFVQDTLLENETSDDRIPTNIEKPTTHLIETLLQQHTGEQVTRFSSSIPSTHFLPVRQLQRSVGRLMRLEPEVCVDYSEAKGSEHLRRQIAIRMLDAGCKVQPDDIIITLGCQNAIILALKAITKPGDVIAIESPTYHGVLQAIELLELNAIEIPCSHNTGIDLTVLQEAANNLPLKAAIITPNYQNPTGATLSSENRKSLLKLCSTYSIPLIEDDVYGELSYSDRRAKALLCEAPNADITYCSSFSKSIAPGFRVGWIISQKYQSKIEHLSYVSSVSTPTLTQTAVANFLENGAYDRHLRKTTAVYKENLNKCKRAIEQYFPPNTEISSPLGGFLLWIILPNSINALALHEQAIQSGIGILPGNVFYIEQQFSHHIRINYALPWSNKVETCLKELGELCVKLQKG
ncbi:PLP-dependent aminotransferase family protein [Marinomonas mediterranea]|jgi:transcriptional regulator, GntR family|uniref:Transcriptional regulator, GntR family with aminotransferase domain n=1 Tax=Marinomonas mediterranea (strain ATCC 700492 / JCM 21426 / NBRC 103028 / MMB-1) TaxID=717774 RepID=F2K126_MARM1|nr:PLP-dependent aminotransferase family protein [Marinomonas mediterranea]ADZ89876.1 transcriptional regulator, GntR family with aminotransferase domain [Marinomonas mediterranea MMB-1]WCN07961.1 aminotransferase class I/II-fold pyridoxal phosphate-dependent enzyme [Marinomonas mediterranea]WCN16094.1 aminotransferase class I/II-fold pyridoxal phosphate-dependent enzyme [Marinomonas mediterranea MMB-1]